VKLFDVVCLVLLGAFLMTGMKVSCGKELPAPAIFGVAQDCAMRCWVDGQGAGYDLDFKTDPTTCVCVPPLDE